MCCFCFHCTCAVVCVYAAGVRPRAPAETHVLLSLLVFTETGWDWDISCVLLCFNCTCFLSVYVPQVLRPRAPAESHVLLSLLVFMRDLIGLRLLTYPHNGWAQNIIKQEVLHIFVLVIENRLVCSPALWRPSFSMQLPYLIKLPYGEIFFPIWVVSITAN